MSQNGSQEMNITAKSRIYVITNLDNNERISVSLRIKGGLEYQDKILGYLGKLGAVAHRSDFHTERLHS